MLNRCMVLCLLLIQASMLQSTWAQSVDQNKIDETFFKPLQDKTMVVWVNLHNLEQRGGSALTIEDTGDRFDAVVFGELAKQKWMAGSEFFRRTAADQTTYPTESASPDELLKVATVYQGTRVAMYRNGVLVSQYNMPSQPAEFGPRSTISIGKRHARQTGDAHFAGMIDDARVYDFALTKEQIDALKPNVASTVKPWAWWDFQQPNVQDLTGRFLESDLQGAARIESGMLVLDGKEANFVAKLGRPLPFRPETPTRPAQVPQSWLTFHLAHPGPGTAMPGDPNCAFFWKGRYHLHYIYRNDDGFAFAHFSSEDMIHWSWHPTTLTPSATGHGMFSGTGFYTKEGRPAIIYHGEGSGRNQIAVALDDNLEQWTKPQALEPIISPGQDASKIANWDPDCWLDGGRYFALSGGSPGSGKPPTLFRSTDLNKWDYLGLFLTRDMPDVKSDEDISCPNFFKIGNKDMLLCISHTLGCRYYLGTWDKEKFTPDFHARMNWNGWDFFAPESVLTADGRRVMWAWCNLGEPQSGIQSLPRELSLPEDGILRIKPLAELEKLRAREIVNASLDVKDQSIEVKPTLTAAVEVEAIFEDIKASSLGLDIHCVEGSTDGFSIRVHPKRKLLTLGSMEVPFDLMGDSQVRLRVFLDQNVVEVFVNDRQAAVASHAYRPGHDGLKVVAGDGSCKATLRAWQMSSIYSKQ